MEQGPLHDKLFRAAQQHLKDHEEAFDASDWDRMDKSLDQLPRGKQFNWSFSLNSVLVLVGLSGLALGGYALLGGNSSGESNSKTPAPAVTTAPAAKKEDVAKTKPVTAQPVSTPVVTAPVTSPAQETQTVADARTTSTDTKRTMKTKRGDGQGDSKRTSNEHSDVIFPGDGSGDFSSDVVFPDQIDKRHGIMFDTQEDPSKLGDIPPVDPEKMTYYDDVRKPIHITTDSSKDSSPKKKRDKKSKKQPEKQPERSLDPPPGDNQN